MTQSLLRSSLEPLTVKTTPKVHGTRHMLFSDDAGVMFGDADRFVAPASLRLMHECWGFYANLLREQLPTYGSYQF